MELRNLESDREKAMKWWDNLNEAARQDYVDQYHDQRSWNSMTGREIELIWKNLTFQP